MVKVLGLLFVIGNVTMCIVLESVSNFFTINVNLLIIIKVRRFGSYICGRNSVLHEIRKLVIVINK